MYTFAQYTRGVLTRSSVSNISMCTGSQDIDSKIAKSNVVPSPTEPVHNMCAKSEPDNLDSKDKQIPESTLECTTGLTTPTTPTTPVHSRQIRNIRGENPVHKEYGPLLTTPLSQTMREYPTDESSPLLKSMCTEI